MGGGTLLCAKAAADDIGDILLGSTTTADVGGTDKELSSSAVFLNFLLSWMF